jgi:hypothetical protein
MILRVLPVRVAATKVYCTYLLDGIKFSHVFTLPTAIDDPAEPTTARLLNWLSVIHTPYLFTFEYIRTIETAFPLSAAEKTFFEKVIFLGMAEFRYVNGIPLTTRTTIEAPEQKSAPMPPLRTDELSGCFLLNGGGKDGSASATILDENSIDFTWFQLNNSVAQDEIVQASGKPVVICKRRMDPRRKEGRYQGHHPTSAAIAITAVLCAWLLKKRDVIASNESSANEGNTTIDGVSINHQYSKSMEFEQDLSALLAEFNIPVRYFSLLRPLHELQIVQLAARGKYLPHFTSCNHGYTQGVWCMACPKCAFIALAFSAVDPETTSMIWPKTPAPLALPGLVPYIQELMSDEQHKPLECVGTSEECRLAAAMVLRNQAGKTLPPALATAFADAAGTIDYNASRAKLSYSLAPHVIPGDYQLILNYFNDTFTSSASSRD